MANSRSIQNGWGRGGGYMEYYSGYGFYEACGKFSRLKNYAWLFFFFRRDMDIAH
uniref:Uncharacterized protein n=1 Tax=Gallid alphaherpesvirus 2 TaxID=10390 RepID=D2Y5T5_9ALPH|nr:hypothetical protein [Gallid alphaherpesvirus 2]